jgi:hypothetical protein
MMAAKAWREKSSPNHCVFIVNNTVSYRMQTIPRLPNNAADEWASLSAMDASMEI